MAKGATQDATSLAKSTSGASTKQLQQGLYGGGAFGPSGLSGDYAEAKKTTSGYGTGAFDAAKGLITGDGGYDPTYLNTIRSNAASIADTGGYDPKQLADLRKNWGETTDFYRGMMGTGGYTPQDVTRQVNQATGGLSNTFQTLAQQAARQRAAQGGLGGDVTANLARAFGQQQSKTTEDALSDVHKAVLDAKFKAATGLGDITKMEGGLETDIATGRRAGVTTQADIERDRAKGVESGRETGAQVMSKLYDTASGNLTSTGKMVLGLMGVDTNNQALSLQTLSEMAQRPGMLDNILKIAGVATAPLSITKTI